MRKLILVAVCVAALTGCQSAKRMEQEREYAEIERAVLVEKVQALPASAKLECQLIGQQAAAAASNPRALVDIVAAAYDVQAQDTCLRMKAAQADEQRDAALPAKHLPACLSRRSAVVCDGSRLPALSAPRR